MSCNYNCGGCGETFQTKHDALKCCGEDVQEVSECCTASIVLGVNREYPLGGTTWGIDYGINVCEKCGSEVE